MSVRNHPDNNQNYGVIKVNKNRVKALTTAAIIAALYSALTYLAAGFGVAYGPIQFRFSEALTVLPVFTPAAIPGLTIGCLISNIASFNPVDMVFGTGATLIAAWLTRAFRKVTLFKAPMLSLLPPVLVNALMVGLEISIFYLDGFTVGGFLISALEVGLGQLVICYGLGLPLYFALNKHRNIFE